VIIKYEPGTFNSEEEFVETNHLQLFPNPAFNVLTIQSPAAMQQIDLYSVDGRLVKTIRVDGVQSHQLEVSALKNGIYIAKIFTGEGTLSSQFEILR
jgi:hypothetical protein